MNSSDLTSVEIKAFVPARDFALSKEFYQAIGFRLAYSDDDLAYLLVDNSSFLLQNFYVKEHAENFQMHLLVNNVDDWYQHIQAQNIAERYGVTVGAPENQPWAMRDFVFVDPSGVLWRIAQNI